ncbi:MAG: nicotinate-nucleotide diphosphorylase (carboxylating), partial [Planctomycetota bacterium]
MEKIRYEDVRLLVELGIAEDIGGGDITTKALFRCETIEGTFAAREEGVLCGMELAREIVERHAPNTKLSDALADGATFEAGAALGGWAGLAVEILPLERLVLNFVQRLS